jgi:hypothetical protein
MTPVTVGMLIGRYFIFQRLDKHAPGVGADPAAVGP